MTLIDALRKYAPAFEHPVQVHRGKDLTYWTSGPTGMPLYDAGLFCTENTVAAVLADQQWDSYHKD